MSKKLVVGLGNPGEKYRNTRHNLGFMILDALAKRYGVKFETKKKLQAEVAVLPEIILAKPLTFMNESGVAVKKLHTVYSIQYTGILIVHDEIDLPFGKIRLSKNSGRSSHQGLRSIIEILGPNFMQLRIGVENRAQYRIPPTEKYVLQNFTREETKKLRDEIIPEALLKI